MDISAKRRLQETGFFFLDRNSESIELLLGDYWKVSGNEIFRSFERKQLESYFNPNFRHTRFSHCETFSDLVEPNSRYQFGSFILFKCGDGDDYLIFDAEKEIK